MNTNELAELIEHLENAKYVGASKAATMLRQQQEQIEELEKENTDLRYLIATKLEQQDGISLNSMAHPITNTPEPSYEIDPNKLETIEIDLPSPEPVAWMLVDKNWNDFCRYSSYPTESAIPLYTHPAKTLTDEEINQVAIDMGMFGDLSHDEIELCRNVLRKAQEK